MTRCKEKLDNLAMLVVSYWPGVKLRVTEAWDEDGYHPPDSLHYEGRAVDIGTSDKDRSKYGMLARLARQAGFDWVYYESKAHIHVSCKTDNALGIKLRGCFHGDARVRTESGEHKPIRSLAVGDRILTALPNGTVAFSPVVLFLDRSPALVLDYLQFSLIDGASLTTTPYHLIYASDDCRDLTLPTIASTIWTFRDTFQPIYAKDVRRGDCILRLSEATNDIFMNKSDLALNRLIPLRVQQVRTLQKKGAFAPLTLAGNIFVDDVLASCYAGHNSESVAHFALFPARLYFVVKDWTLSQLQKCCTTLFDGFLSSDARQEMTEGIHPYARLLIWMRDLLAL